MSDSSGMFLFALRTAPYFFADAARVPCSTTQPMGKVGQGSCSMAFLTRSQMDGWIDGGWANYWAPLAPFFLVVVA